MRINTKGIKAFLRDAKAVSPAIATLILIVIAAVAAAGIGILVSHSQASSKDMLDSKTASVQGKINIDGSTTVLPITLLAAPTFMADNPSYTVTASGGGSNVGMEDVFNKNVDIGASSSRWPDTDTTVTGYSTVLPARSKAIIQEAGQGATIWETAIGTGMIVIATNIPNATRVDIVPGNTSSWSGSNLSISYGDLQNLYVSGKGTLGSVNNETFTAVQRSDQSGTEDTFSAWLGKQDSASKQLDSTVTAIGEQGNQGIRDYISAHPNSIGFVDISFVNGQVNGAPNVNAATMNGVAASSTTKGVGTTNVTTGATSFDAASKVVFNGGTYSSTAKGLARDLFYYSYGVPTGAVKSYIDFILSSKGQDAVHNAGFFSIG